jgi:hypothetical protein
MQDDAYTFLANSPAGATVLMDIAAFDDDERARRHVLDLWNQHNSADVVEVWRLQSDRSNSAPGLGRARLGRRLERRRFAGARARDARASRVQTRLGVTGGAAPPRRARR